MKRKTSAIQGKELLNIDIFSTLSLKTRKLIATKMQRRFFKNGEVLFLEGEEGRELFALLEGTVSINIRSSDGEGIELATVGAGAFFGEMAILERTVRSATVRAKGEVESIVLADDDFDSLFSESPEAASAILERMIRMSASRLINTGSFLSHMITWGEEARKRTITDPMTGLFNRRYLDESLEASIAEARLGEKSLSLAMFDLDHFAQLNARLGTATCDQLLVLLADIFRDNAGEDDILIRYGGDEFCFLMKESPEKAYRRSLAICHEIVNTDHAKNLDLESSVELRLSASIGLAVLTPDIQEGKNLIQRADDALYRAKEAGRNRVFFWQEDFGIKKDIQSIAEKNRRGHYFAQALSERESFLVIGHEDPDEDCISSMVAFALLAAKFSKRAMVALGPKINENYEYLLQICHYNGIELFRGEEIPETSTLVLVDTPKPKMIDRPYLYEALRADPAVLKLEIDHHLGADSRHFTGPEGSLVFQASSSCEIIAWLILKLQNNKELLQKHHIDDLLSRNLVLAILSGILGDTQMGQLIRNKKERQYYNFFTGRLERILSEKTHAGSGNLATKEQIFTTLNSLSKSEEACWKEMISHKKEFSSIHSVTLSKEASDTVLGRYGSEICISVSKSIANKNAEDSKFFGLVGYYDKKDDLVQFRLRRAKDYTELDLRDFLKRLDIKDGGGHPGAIGFRLKSKNVKNIATFEELIARTIAEMIAENKELKAEAESPLDISL